MLPLVIQLGPVQIEHAAPALLRVHGGLDQPEVIAALMRADATLDGSRRCWWVQASRLRELVSELREKVDPLMRVSVSLPDQPSPSSYAGSVPKRLPASRT